MKKPISRPHSAKMIAVMPTSGPRTESLDHLPRVEPVRSERTIINSSVGKAGTSTDGYWPP